MSLQYCLRIINLRVIKVDPLKSAVWVDEERTAGALSQRPRIGTDHQARGLDCSICVMLYMCHTYIYMCIYVRDGPLGASVAATQGQILALALR